MKNIILMVCVLTVMEAQGAYALMTRHSYNPKPMVEGNRRVDEIIAWGKEHPGEMPPLTEQEKYEFFTKNGTPVPGSGAIVVDKIPGYKIPAEYSTRITKFNAAQKEKGYYEEMDKRVKILLEMPEIAEQEYNARKSVGYNQHDTHLYEVKSNLPMHYAYKGIPKALATQIIGYAPESIFVNDGWAGAVVFFVPSFGGVCAYHEVNIEITKSSAYINKEIATTLVNNKVTTMNAVGTKESGFVYEIEWWDAKFKRTLECAQKVYSTKYASETIELAKQIDKA